MITPDIIVTWPKNADYPLWRQYIHDFRAQFNEIIVVFMESNQEPDYREWLKQAMFTEHVLFVESPPYRPDEDWRNVAIHAALQHSYNAPWIFFTEQDLTINDGFWVEANKMALQGYNAMAMMDSSRIHPAALLIEREALNRTRKQFGVVTDKLDHFGLIQEDIQNPDNHIKFGVFDSSLYSHMNGLTSNMSLAFAGNRPNWRIEEFNKYMTKTLRISVPINPDFADRTVQYLQSSRL